MPSQEIFESSVREKGDLAGVFEYDGEVGYFYLYDTTREHGTKILESIHILSGEVAFSETDVSVRWDHGQQKVGLFILGTLWAVFDANRRLKYGGNYDIQNKPIMPPEALSGFGRSS